MSEHKPDSDADKTHVRQKPNKDKTKQKSDAHRAETSGRPAENPDASAETVIRNSDEGVDPGSTTILRDSHQSDDEPKTPGATGSGSATILKDPDSKIASDEATILRGPASASDGDSTILREPGQDQTAARSSQATILRSGDEMRRSPPDAATVLRDGGAEDGDRTVLNNPDDEDATLLGSGPDGADTTYIASVGPQKPRGNSEAGRLLKNRFVLEEKVGSGGMGDVYKALDLRQQEAKERNPYIAIKILNESFARHKDAFISLQRETTRTRGIPHPNIMAVYDFDKEGDTVFMSMELLDGKPLDDYLKEHPEGVSVEDAWNIIEGICQGLGRAHGAGIVHSDFKPGNIYYTTDKNCKVFDFGIARAVSSPGELEADGEKTVFDAGSLGALTPTYASYEMLKGLEPTKSDDVYAVALVAYELFTGKHPYNRVAADKALERGMEPEPVPFLKRRHWKALRKALEIKGENRTQSIDEFYEGMFSEDPPYLRYGLIAAILVASIGFGVYQQFFRAEPVVPEAFTEVMTSYRSSQSNIETRLEAPEFSSANWRTAVERAVNQMVLDNIEMKENFGEYLDENWEQIATEEIQTQREAIMNKYLERIVQLRSIADGEVVDSSNKEQLESAVSTLDFAAELMEVVKDDYNFDPTATNPIELALVEARSRRETQLEQIIRDEEAAEQARIAAEEARLAAAAEAERIAQRDAAYLAQRENFERILSCKGDIPDGSLYGNDGIEGAIASMRQTYPAQFAVDKPGIVAALNGCITQRVAVRDPDRARVIKSAVVAFLPNEPLLANIEISDLDECAARILVGQGSRNRRWCEDKLATGDVGPELVVIPPKTGRTQEQDLGTAYGISRLEIRIGDYNKYCEDAGCQRLQGPSALPATNLTLEQAEGYADWLSNQSGRTYRIPTVEEWLHAATTEGTAEVDENVNCTVDSRGVRLGDRLLNTLSGRPNSWGLYNHVGNAREWAIQKPVAESDNQSADGAEAAVPEENLMALGGAHTDPKAECTLSKRVGHSGEADPVTGFRLVREISYAKAGG